MLARQTKTDNLLPYQQAKMDKLILEQQARMVQQEKKNTELQ
jgi:hypothetical protein